MNFVCILTLSQAHLLVLTNARGPVQVRACEDVPKPLIFFLPLVWFTRWHAAACVPLGMNDAMPLE